MEKENIKEFSTAWLIEEVRLTKEATHKGNEKIALSMLLNDLERYIEHISKNAANKGKGTSKLKAKTSAANGAKGGRPKGSKNKPKEAEVIEPEVMDFLKGVHHNFSKKDLENYLASKK